MENSLTRIMKEITVKPTRAEKQSDLTALLSLFYKMDGEMRFDYNLRSNILSVMPTNLPLRVKDLQALPMFNRFTIQKLTRALLALQWAGAVKRIQTDETVEIWVDEFVGYGRGTNGSGYRKKKIEVPIVKYVKII